MSPFEFTRRLPSARCELDQRRTARPGFSLRATPPLFPIRHGYCLDHPTLPINAGRHTLVVARRFTPFCWWFSGMPTDNHPSGTQCSVQLAPHSSPCLGVCVNLDMRERRMYIRQTL